MDTTRDVIADLSSSSNRTTRYIMARLDESGGLPTVVLPLAASGGVATQGKGCRTIQEYYDAMSWVIRTSPVERAKVIPAALTAPPS